MKTVVVTGATSGIGRATALDLAAHGFDVIATARTSDKAQKLRAAAAERGHALRTVLLDVTEAPSCQDAVAEIQDLAPDGPWALVNNAGIAIAGAFEDVSEAEARSVLEVNLLGAARMTRLVLPGMLGRGEGRIIQMSSVGGRMAVPVNGWYCASKHALEALTDALRMEITGSGVRLSLIEPGFVDTPLVSGALAGFPTDSRYRDAYAAVRRLAVARLQPEDVARTVRRALSARNPRPRYRLGLEGVLTSVARVSPSRAVDTAVRAALRLKRA